MTYNINSKRFSSVAFIVAFYMNWAADLLISNFEHWCLDIESRTNTKMNVVSRWPKAYLFIV